MKLNIHQYKNIVILTGAGISAASGIRTYRGPNGVWSEYDVQEYGHVDRLRDSPEKIWQLFGPLRTQLKSAQPNPAHTALAKLEEQLTSRQNYVLITQNVDGLHQRAGCRNVIEMHGSITKTRCVDALCTLPAFIDDNPYEHGVPHCPVCANILRPDIVLFGEQIPISEGW